MPLLLWAYSPIFPQADLMLFSELEKEEGQRRGSVGVRRTREGNVKNMIRVCYEIIFIMSPIMLYNQCLLNKIKDKRKKRVTSSVYIKWPQTPESQVMKKIGWVLQYCFSEQVVQICEVGREDHLLGIWNEPRPIDGSGWKEIVIQNWTQELLSAFAFSVSASFCSFSYHESACKSRVRTARQSPFSHPVYFSLLTNLNLFPCSLHPLSSPGHFLFS